MTRALALLSTSGALALLGRVGALEPLARLLSAVRFGSDAFVAQVEAQGGGGTARALVCGLKEARITGLVASLVAESLGTTSPLPGIRHIEEIFELKHFASTLEEVGYAVIWARKPSDLRARQSPGRGEGRQHMSKREDRSLNG